MDWYNNLATPQQQIKRQRNVSKPSSQPHSVSKKLVLSHSEQRLKYPRPHRRYSPAQGFAVLSTILRGSQGSGSGSLHSRSLM